MKPIHGFSLLVLAAFGCSPLASAFGQANNPSRVHQLKSLKVTVLGAAGHKIDAWIMDNEQKREEGMMFLTDKEVKSNQGMIFVFSAPQPESGRYAFWMHNTLIPLDIIYISASKKVINVGLGKRLDDTPVLPKGDYKFVLELKQGTAKKLGIKPGMKVSIPDSVVSID
ncbi:MAG: DUF192 domain-containing protein [Fimbriimonas sp.]|nr:DUF192 domain-containing protein [Fimbriimonas sp.]